MRSALLASAAIAMMQASVQPTAVADPLDLDGWAMLGRGPDPIQPLDPSSGGTRRGRSGSKDGYFEAKVARNRAKAKAARKARKAQRRAAKR